MGNHLQARWDVGWRRPCALRAAILVAYAATASCGRKEAVETWGAPDVMVRVEPPDRTTAARDVPIRLIVGNTGAEVRETLLSAISERISLVDEVGVDVPVEARIEPLSQALPYGRYVDVLPQEVLASRWHSLRIDLRDTTAGGWPTLVEVSERVFESRFHPDSHPVIRSIQFCQAAEESRGELRVEVSEAVSFVPTEVGVEGRVPFAARVGEIDCAMLPSAAPDVQDEYASSFLFSCDGVAARPDVVSVSLVFPVVSASGQPLSLLVNSPADAEVVLRFDDAYEIADCSGWVMP